MQHSWLILSVFCMFIVLIMGVTYCRKKDRAGYTRYKISSGADVMNLFPKSPEDITLRIERGMEQAKNVINTIIAIPDEKRTFANTAKALDELDSLSDLVITIKAIHLLEQLSPDEAIRTAAHEAIIKVENFFIEHISTNVALYKAFKAYVQGNAKHETLSPEQRYFLMQTMDDFKREGLDLPDDQLQKVRALKQELASLTLKFETNVAQEKRTITVKRAELEGLDDDFINSLKRSPEGDYLLGVDYPTYLPVMDYCSYEPTRKKLYTLFDNRAYPVNEALLKEVIAKRDQLAKLLEFSSYATFALANQMVGSVDRAEQFLHNLLERLVPKEQQEFEQLTADLPPSVQLTADGKIKPWDFQYLLAYYKKKHFDIDERMLADYFPTELTMRRLLEIYKKFLNIDFKEVPITGAWHEDVKLIEVHVAGNGGALGYLLIDLHPRPNKFSHAAHESVVPATYDAQGKRIPAVDVIMANFPKSTVTKPSLLKRGDVETFFHEFGHTMHSILGSTSIASLSGTATKLDFVEMPSQMFEEWIWDKEMLKMISHHYKTGHPLPDLLIDSIVALKRFSSGFFIQRQAYLALLSLNYFTDGADKDLQGVMRDLYVKIRRHIAFEPHDHMYASFGHLMGYGARYYSYLWSKVYALDFFAEIKKAGLLNPEIGQRYVKVVLGKGGATDPNIILKNFLGREPSPDAFFEDLGL